jgi:hypothetical protein
MDGHGKASIKRARLCHRLLPTGFANFDDIDDGEFGHRPCPLSHSPPRVSLRRSTHPLPSAPREPRWTPRLLVDIALTCRRPSNPSPWSTPRLAVLAVSARDRPPHNRACWFQRLWGDLSDPRLSSVVEPQSTASQESGPIPAVRPSGEASPDPRGQWQFVERRQDLPGS